MNLRIALLAPSRAQSRPAAVPAPVHGPNDATVNGIEIHFGLVLAERLRAYPRESTRAATPRLPVRPSRSTWCSWAAPRKPGSSKQ
jgi:hypothetical protein